MRYGFGDKVWQKTHCRFYPPTKEEDLVRCYNNRIGNTIVVPSLQADNDYEYRFEGICSFDEFWRAVLYVMSIDFKKNGLMSCLARDYVPVYRHSQYTYVERYLRLRKVFC